MNEDLNDESTLVTRCLRKLPDPDEVFAYETTGELIVLDRKLGYTMYISLFLIIVYIIGFEGVFKKSYLKAFGVEG